VNLNFSKFAEERTARKEPPGLIFSQVTSSGFNYSSYGTISLESEKIPNPDTVFEIGSNTKLFTSLLLARLMDLGQVSLDDPIRDYLPSRIRVPERNGKQISFVHLATHSSGLPPMPDNFDFENVTDAYSNYDVEDLYRSLDKTTLHWDIGKSYVYSNLGYCLLGHLIEEIAGQPFEQLVTEHICNPLGMFDTRIQFDSRTNNIATPYMGSRRVPWLNFKAMGTAGALKSTAKDMSTFIAHNIGLLDSELSHAMKQCHEIFFTESELLKMGLGWHIQNRNSRKLFWHRGETLGQTSFVAFEPGSEAGVVMLSNMALGECCCDLAISHLDPLEMPREMSSHEFISLTLSELEKYVGEYRLDPSISFHITARNNHLLVALTGQKGGLMYPVTETVFETKDHRVSIQFLKADGNDVLMLKQHGIDRVAIKRGIRKDNG
jgi:CubicO group peptidase (beta-lactamase class C family)